MNREQQKAMFAGYSRGQKDLLTKLHGVEPVLSKQDMQNIKNAINGSSGGEKSREFGRTARDLIAHKNDQEGGVRIDNAFKQQGLVWLKKQKELAWRERNAVENNIDFRLTGFRDISLYGQTPFHEPTYSVSAKDSDFDYNYNRGKVDISG